MNLDLLIINWIAFSKGVYQSFLVVGPIIIYDILTMCLLSGPSLRYFYFNSVLIFPVVGVVLLMINEKNMNARISKSISVHICKEY